MQPDQMDLKPLIFSSPILIIDDNEINRLVIEKSLLNAGFTNILSVNGGEAALAQLATFNPDMVILDIMMPGMDGFECCQEIRRRKSHRDLPVLIQTALTEPDMRVKAFAAGATDFICKPIFPPELCARVLVQLERRHTLKALQLYKSRMDMELESARQLQHSILPSLEEVGNIEQSYRLDIASHFQTSSEIGGDFWGMKQLFPQQIAMWLVDFSGHGVASALNAFRLQAYIKEHSALMSRPGEYLSHLNEKLLHLLLPGQFATMFYGIADLQSNRLLYSCACAPHPILLRQSDGKAQMIDGSGVPLGIGMQQYATQSVAFMPGDVLVLYSDALVETPNTAGDFITETEIAALLEKHAGASSYTLKELLMDHFRHHTGNIISDDITINFYRRNATEDRRRNG